MSANVADFELRLKDSVTGPAKQAADAMRRFEAQAVKAQLAAQRAAERAATTQRREAERVENAWKKMAATQERQDAQRAASIRKLGVAQAQAAAINNRLEQQAVKMHERATAATEKARAKQAAAAEKATVREAAALRKLGLVQIAAQKEDAKRTHEQSFGFGLRSAFGLEGIGGRVATGAFWGGIAAAGVEKAADLLVDAAHKVVDVFRDGFQAIGAEQQRQAGYKLTLGASAGFAARSDVEKFKGLTAFSGSQNQDLMLPLYRAGLKGQEARNAYAAALDLAAGQGKGADQGAVASAVDTFAQIQRKGGVTSRQLAGIGLGETNLPAFYKSLGGMLGVDAKTAETRAAQPGGVDPQLLRNVIYDAIEKQQGGKLGSGGGLAARGLEGQFNKLRELPNDYFEGLANSKALAKFSDTLSNVLVKLDPDGPTGKRIFAALEKTLDALATAAEKFLDPKTMEAFATGIERVAGAMASIAGSAATIAGFYIGTKKDEADFTKLGGGDAAKGAIVDMQQNIGAARSSRERADAAWDKIKKAENIGWWRDLNMQPEERRDLVRAGLSKGEVTPDEASGFGIKLPAAMPSAPVVAAAKTVIINNNTNVDASGHDEDADGAHRRAARKVARHIGAEMERAAAEGGA